LLNDTSEAQRLNIARQLGWNSLPGATFQATDDGDGILIEGKGEGHGVGVCQRGIIGLARDGEDFRALLSKYLPQTRTASVR
jgi:stage II sporulation protein D